MEYTGAFDFDGVYNDELGQLFESGLVSIEDLEYELDYRAANGGQSASDMLSAYSPEEVRWVVDSL